MNRTELLKIAKPILFNTEMVRAILEGRKTVTRRLIKIPHYLSFWGTDEETKEEFSLFGSITLQNDGEEYGEKLKPKYRKGDILYVRETFNNIETTSVLYAADKEFIDFGCKEVDGYMFMESEIKWHPSIHMPKSAARIFLKVTDVRVERLQDITEEQAIKEGFEGIPCGCSTTGCTDCYDFGWREPPEVGFMYTWDSTIKKQDLDKYGWDANPWVWVYEFERINNNENNNN